MAAESANIQPGQLQVLAYVLITRCQAISDEQLLCYYVCRGNSSLCSMQVGPRHVWKAAEHPFRTDKQMQLTGIPTLVQCSDSGLGARLSSQLEQAKTAAEAESAAKSFITNAAQNSHAANGHSL